MSLPSLTSPPPAPSRDDDSSSFVAKANAFIAWLVTFVAEMIAVIAAIPEIAAAANYNTTSSISVAIGTGAQTFTVPTGGLLQIGQFVIAASEAAPSNYMAGQVVSHDTTTGELTVNVIATGGSGSHSDWIIAVTVADALEPVAAIAITGSGTDLEDGTVSLAKIVDLGTNKLLGSIAGGPPVQIGLGSGLSFSGGNLAVSAGTATLADGDYGHVTASAGGTVIELNDGVVDATKMADLLADTLIGSMAGGTPEEIACTGPARTLLAQATQAAMRTTGLGLGTSATEALQWALNFTAAGDVYIPVEVAMTINQGNAKIGTGTIAFAKSTASAPGTFNSATLPVTLEAGAWLKVTASAVTGFVATHLKRTA